MQKVLVLQVYTTVDIDHVADKMAAITRATGRWCKWTRQHRLNSFVIVSDETSMELRRRLSPVLDDQAGIGGVYCFTAPDDLVGNHGEWEGLRFHIDAGRLEVRKRQDSRDMRHAHSRRFDRKGPM
jgi:hypothetical protein